MVTADDQTAPGTAAPTGFRATARAARATGGLVMIAAVVLLALNLRPAVNALGVVMPELRADTGLSGTVAGILIALPTLSFALIGFAAAPLAARFGTNRTVFASVVAITVGQFWRAAVGGQVALFGGSALTLAGIALGNVLLPGLVRQHFPRTITAMTAVYTTVLLLGQTIGSGITVPIQQALGGTWRLGIGMWTATAVVALVPWVVAAVREGAERRAPAPAAGGAHPAGNEPPVSVWALFRSPRAWAMVAFFGTQSFQAYVVFGWVPEVLTDAGMSETEAAWMLAIITAMGVPISALVPTALGSWLRTTRSQAALTVAFIAATAVGYAWLIVAPAFATILPSLLIGFGLGAFPMALTLFALRARTPSGTTALSAFGQSIGYLWASVGPIGFGFLHDVSGGWTLPLATLITTLSIMLVGGLVVVRPWHIEDDVADRSMTSPS